MNQLDQTKRCVIADDTRAFRELIARWLRSCHFRCELAENGLQAWELIETEPPDLLVTDLEMPKLCGLELLERIRQADQKSIRKLPVLVMTSLQDGQTLNIVRSIGGNGLLHKPLDRQATLSVVLNLVAGKHALDRINDPDPKCPSGQNGVISPTLRRLLSTVASYRNDSGNQASSAS